jgi:hypothetical protein
MEVVLLPRQPETPTLDFELGEIPVDALEYQNRNGIEVQGEATLYSVGGSLVSPTGSVDNPTLYQLLQKETSE